MLQSPTKIIQIRTPQLPTWDLTELNIFKNIEREHLKAISSADCLAIERKLTPMNYWMRLGDGKLKNAQGLEIQIKSEN